MTMHVRDETYEVEDYPVRVFASPCSRLHGYSRLFLRRKAVRISQESARLRSPSSVSSRRPTVSEIGAGELPPRLVQSVPNNPNERSIGGDATIPTPCPHIEAADKNKPGPCGIDGPQPSSVMHITGRHAIAMRALPASVSLIWPRSYPRIPRREGLVSILPQHHPAVLAPRAAEYEPCFNPSPPRGSPPPTRRLPSRHRVAAPGS